MSIDSPQRTEPDRPLRSGHVVYLAEPPEGGALAETWGETATYRLNLAGYHVYRPIAAWRYAEVPEDRRATSINRHALGLADALVAVLPSTYQAGMAVPMEIEAALGLGLPVVVVSQHAEHWLGQRPGVTVVRDATEVAGAVTKALAVASPVDRERSGPLGRVVGNHYVPRAPHPGTRVSVHAQQTLTIPSGTTVVMPTDRFLDATDGGYGLLVARNMGLASRGLWVITGLVVEGGPLVCQIHNVGRLTATVQAGERIADLLLYTP